jgi:predicted DNA-binding protein (MmcQ/YjbR family)
MNVEFIQRFCLSFPHATENLQWGENLCFKVGGKIFAVLDLSSVPPRLSFKSAVETFAELVERDGISPAAYVGRYNWVALERVDVLPWSELQELLSESYAMVSAKAKVGKAVRKKRQTSKGAKRRKKKAQ